MVQKFSFGVQKPCTPEQFKEETKELYAKCTLKNVGTFYFAFTEAISEGKQYRSVFLKFYDEERHIMHTSEKDVCRAVKGGNIRVIPLNCFVFSIEDQVSTYILVMSSDWTSSRLLQGSVCETALQKAVLEEPPLSKIRKDTPGEFTLECTTGEKIKVHTAVLVPLWPFFAAALESDKQAKAKKTMKFECSFDTLLGVVDFLYKDSFYTEDIDALIDFAQKKEVPGLLEELFEDFEKNPNPVLALKWWEVGVATKNERFRTFSATLLKERLSKSPELEKWLSSIPKEDMPKLLMEIWQSFGDRDKKKRKIATS